MLLLTKKICVSAWYDRIQRHMICFEPPGSHPLVTNVQYATWWLSCDHSNRSNSSACDTARHRGVCPFLVFVLPLILISIKQMSIWIDDRIGRTDRLIDRMTASKRQVRLWRQFHFLVTSPPLQHWRYFRIMRTLSFLSVCNTLSQYITVRYSTEQYALHYTALQCEVLHCRSLYSTLQYHANHSISLCFCSCSCRICLE